MQPIGRVDDRLVGERPRPLLQILRIVFVIAMTSILVTAGIAIVVVMTVD